MLWKQKQKRHFRVKNPKMVEGHHVFCSESLIKGLEMTYVID